MVRLAYISHLRCRVMIICIYMYINRVIQFTITHSFGIFKLFLKILANLLTPSFSGPHGRNRMVVGFTTTYAISAYHYRCCEVESRSGRGVLHYVIKFVSDLRQVCGFPHQ